MLLWELFTIATHLCILIKDKSKLSFLFFLLFSEFDRFTHVPFFVILSTFGFLDIFLHDSPSLYIILTSQCPMSVLISLTLKCCVLHGSIIGLGLFSCDPFPPCIYFSMHQLSTTAGYFQTEIYDLETQTLNIQHNSIAQLNLVTISKTKLITYPLKIFLKSCISAELTTLE